jgi:hypothetical protein
MRKFFFLIGDRAYFPSRQQLEDDFLQGKLRVRDSDPRDLELEYAGLYEVQIPDSLSIRIETHSINARLPRANLDVVEIAEMIGLALAAKDGWELTDNEQNLTAIVEE